MKEARFIFEPAVAVNRHSCVCDDSALVSVDVDKRNVKAVKEKSMRENAFLMNKVRLD